MTTSGHVVVLTSEPAIASDTMGSSLIGFLSALPENLLGDRLSSMMFGVESDSDGIARRAPYGLAKVEAKLRESGIDAVIASPYELHRAIGPRTKVVGIYTMDGMGYSYGSGITYWIVKLAGLPYAGLPYIARSFRYVVGSANVSPFRHNFRVVVGGPAAWQVLDSGMQDRLGIDIVFEGEFERDGPPFFRALLSGESVPRVVHARPAGVDEVARIVTPSNGGIVEVTRGCGRGCAFCTPNLSGMIRSFPFEGHIEDEMRLNLERGGADNITLHSEEYFRYGASGIDPRPEKVIELTRKAYRLVKSYGDDRTISIDFTTAAVVAQEPGMVRRVGEYVNEGGRHTFIEMGIETASPSLLERYMRGKALPYRPIEYPDIVVEAIGTLNDNGWIVVGTMILNFPGETDEDVIANLELLDRPKDLRVVTFPLPLVPVAAFRNGNFAALDDLMEDPLRREFVLRALLKAFDDLTEGVRMVTAGIRNPLRRVSLTALGLLLLGILRRRYAARTTHLPIEQLSRPPPPRYVSTMH
ncbi:B12-binding domain-containing radical SAM protein [Conexivisphaera calida]|uniref:B12-binding domain-containing radical SAM protein n=1 Tax=Conexivisphaera calida TaxID=1874277 RepID=UPI00157A69B3|nr:radical SAM protein [Conexivisphaera calida]